MRCLTIHPLITGYLIAVKNGILIESLLLESNFRVTVYFRGEGRSKILCSLCFLYYLVFFASGSR